MSNGERSKLEDLALHFSCSVNALKAIYYAMAEDPNDPADYIDGLYAVRRQLDALVEELTAIVDGGEETV